MTNVRLINSEKIEIKENIVRHTKILIKFESLYRFTLSLLELPWTIAKK